MKRHWITTVAACFTLLLLTGSLIAADDAEKTKRPDRKQGQKQGMKRGRRGPRKMPDIGLSDAQKVQIEAIRKGAHAKIKEADPKDRKELFEAMREEIHGILTKEQVAKLKEAHKNRQGQGGRADLGLSDEQKEKMAALRKATAAKLKDAKGEDRKAIMEGMKKQVAAILTEEQLEKFKQAHQNRRKRPDIGLTDDQKSQIEGIRKAATAAAKDAKGEDRKAIMEKMHKDIQGVFTDEQREKIKKFKENHPNARRGGPRGKGEGEGRADKAKGKGKGEGRGDRKNRKGAGNKGGKKQRPASE